MAHRMQSWKNRSHLNGGSTPRFAAYVRKKSAADPDSWEVALSFGNQGRYHWSGSDGFAPIRRRPNSPEVKRMQQNSIILAAIIFRSSGTAQMESSVGSNLPV